MTISERRSMMLGAIEKLGRKLDALTHDNYDGALSPKDRIAEINLLESHLVCAHRVLVLLNLESSHDA